LLDDHFQEYKLARKHYEQAPQIKTGDDEIITNLAVLLADHFQEQALARKHFEQALRKNDDAEAHYNLALLLKNNFRSTSLPEATLNRPCRYILTMLIKK
jgi:Flp pilus assembly protein TadD